MNKEKRYVDLDEVIKTILSLTYLDDGCDLLSYEVIHAIEDLPTICDVMNDLRLDIDGYIRIVRSKYRELDPNDVLYNPGLAKSKDYFDGMLEAFYLAQARIIANMSQQRERKDDDQH